MSIWFSSDWHLSHKNIIKYCNRPFSSVEDMDMEILENFFSVVKRGDIFYFVGDLTFSKDIAKAFMDKVKSFKVHLHFIFGNHDYNIKNIVSSNCDWSGDLKSIDINGKTIILSHYAMRVWHKSHYNSINLYGHSHGNLEGVGKQMDVGVDTNNFKPYHIDEIFSIMENKPDNFNLVNRRE
jgi:calcineurin-like phosphoesterase family protein